MKQVLILIIIWETVKWIIKKLWNKIVNNE